MQWIRFTENKVFNNIQRMGRTLLKDEYPDINFTTSDKVSGTAKFPTVYVKKMQGEARGQTLEDARVNAILSTYQIEVATNTNQKDAEVVADEIAEIMIDMGYSMIGEPFSDNTSDTYRNISRWQRLIGHNDVLNF